MTLDEAPAIALGLGGRQAGNLITAIDWNSVTEMLALFGNTLLAQRTAVATLETTVAALTAQVAGLADLPARVTTLENRVGPLLENYLVDVSTTTANNLVGEIVELTISVRALDGSAITGNLPWVDVFATWGRLRGAPGFTTRENAEENALSVQVDATGVAKLQLRSQYTKGFKAADETEFSKLLQAQVGTTGQTMKAIIATAATPDEEPVKLALRSVHAQYAANKTTQGYLDNYVSAYTGGRYGPDQVKSLGAWEDHRATVLIFAKPDADPLTPDPARGIATIQVDFREWISKWVGDYWGDLVDITPTFDGVLPTFFDKEDIVKNTILQLDKMNLTSGVLGQTRNSLALQASVAKINPGTDPVRQQAKDLIDGAMKMQIATGGASGTEVALGYAAQAQASNAATQQAQAAQTQATQAQGVKAAVDVLEGRMKAAEETGRTINDSLTRIGDGVNKINVVEVADLGSRLQKINADVSNLAGLIQK